VFGAKGGFERIVGAIVFGLEDAGGVDVELCEEGHGGCGNKGGIARVDELFVVEEGAGAVREADGAQAGETGRGCLDHDAVEGEVGEHGGVKVQRTKNAEGVVFAAVEGEGEGGESGERDVFEDVVEDDAQDGVGCMEGEGGDAGDERAHGPEGVAEVGEAVTGPELDSGKV